MVKTEDCHQHPYSSEGMGETYVNGFPKKPEKVYVFVQTLTW